MPVPTNDLALLARSIDPLVELTESADPSAVAAAESALGVDFPSGLRHFLSQSDGATIGVRLTSSEVVPNASPLIWPVSEIVARNRAANTGAGISPHSQFLFFADAGADGMLFGHPVNDHGVALDRVVAYYPVDERAVVVATDLRAWLAGWLGGNLVI